MMEKEEPPLVNPSDLVWTAVQSVFALIDLFHNDVEAAAQVGHEDEIFGFAVHRISKGSVYDPVKKEFLAQVKSGLFELLGLLLKVVIIDEELLNAAVGRVYKLFICCSFYGTAAHNASS